MVKCPLCEHTQAAGSECESCGTRLSVGPVAAVPVAPLLELEGTLHAPVAAVPSAKLLELEVTHHESEPDWGGTEVEDLLRTRAEGVGPVPTAAIAELEQHRAAPDTQRTVLSAAAGQTCRYCRNVQATGLLCDKCGMRLPKVAGQAAAATGTSAGQKKPPAKTRCRSCGAVAVGGQRCGDCGREVALPEA